MTRAVFRDREPALHLDTGARETLLFPRFAREFSELVKASGKPETRRVTGVGQSVELDSVLLPEISPHLGGFDGRLRPARESNRGE